LCSDEDGGLAGDWDSVFAVGRFGVVVMKGFEVFLELEGGIELGEVSLR
jgi:hypothetical protein